MSSIMSANHHMFTAIPDVTMPPPRCRHQPYSCNKQQAADLESDDEGHDSFVPALNGLSPSVAFVAAALMVNRQDSVGTFSHTASYLTEHSQSERSLQQSPAAGATEFTIASPPSTPSPRTTDDDHFIAALAEAMTCLPLADIEAARHATPMLAAAADRVAPKPLGTDDVAFVRWVPQELNTTLPPTKAQKAAKLTGAAVPAMFRWVCLACNTRTAGPRYCRACRTPMSEGACRVFIGQLRKELTAELMASMLRCLLPGLDLLHVESHTNPSDGTGKGCAWVFVGSVEDARRVVSLHKRVFVDVDADGCDGYWFAINDNQELVEQLEEFAGRRVTDEARPSGLPRLPLVAEAPARSRISELFRHLK